MSEGFLNNVNGSISNRVVASNIRNGYSLPANMMIFSGECETPQQKELIDTGYDAISFLKIAEFGMAGLGFNTQRCARTLRTRIEEAIITAEEKSVRRGNSLKIQYTTVFPTGTSSTIGPLAANLARSKGIDPFVFQVIPDNLSESYQLINTINSLALVSRMPVIMI